MSNNSRKGPSGRKIQVTAPTGGLTSGDLYSLKTGTTGWVGEVVNDADAGDTAIIEVGHQVEIAKNTGTGESFDIGDLVYKDANTGDATATATGNDYIGRATAAATTAATTVWVMFAPAGG